jgi:hypothetical protein
MLGLHAEPDRPLRLVQMRKDEEEVMPVIPVILWAGVPILVLGGTYVLFFAK